MTQHHAFAVGYLATCEGQSAPLMSFHKNHNNYWDKKAYSLIERTQSTGITSNEDDDEERKSEETQVVRFFLG